MIICVHHTQEKVYYKLAVDFLTSDSFSSNAKMSIIGNHNLLQNCENRTTLKDFKNAKIEMYNIY